MQLVNQSITPQLSIAADRDESTFDESEIRAGPSGLHADSINRSAIVV